MKHIKFYLAVILSMIIVLGNAQNHEIKRLEGEDSQYSQTSIEWKNQKEMFAWNKKTGDEEMWSDADKKDFNDYAALCQGGELMLRIKRITIESADMEWFTIIIKKGNVEIQRTQLKKKIANVPGADDLWSNLKTISIKPKITTPFDVFVIEAGGKPPKYHFQIVN